MDSICSKSSLFFVKDIPNKNTNMAKVVIYRGDIDLSLKTDGETTYCYQIGVGRDSRRQINKYK